MAVSSKVAAAALVRPAECASRRFKPIGRGFGSVSQQAAPDCLIDGLGHCDRFADKADPYQPESGNLAS
jgi:hypothetical protein